jgi:hypothetical protein
MSSNKEEYFNFLSNPQKHGIWCLKIEFSNSAKQKLTNIFNLNIYDDFNSMIYFRERYGEDGNTSYNLPILLPRIFSYLRSTMTKKERESLQDLFPTKDYDEAHRFSKYLSYRNFPYGIREMTNIPSNLSVSKKKIIAKAAKIYKKEFAKYVIYTVPENYSKLDFIDLKNLEYFQVYEDNSNSISILSPDKKILTIISNLFIELGIENKAYFLKIYSPENYLMELYVPIVNIIRRTNFINDNTIKKNISQGLEEIKEHRFAHCIRAIGIGAEESLVEIYETYIRDKAKEAPLGNILSDLNNKIQIIVYGKSNKKDFDFKKVKTSMGKIIQNENQKAQSNSEFVEFLVFFQKEIINILEKYNKFIEEISEQSMKNQSLPIFPNYVLRCLNDLITLRNRVSHRIERGTSIVNVGYIESSIALRSFIGIVYWWQKEKLLINYDLSRKEIIASTIERSKIINEEDIASN